MPILSVVGRKHLSTKIMIGFIYIFCIVGSIIFTYPFMLMLSKSTTNAVDSDELDLIPKYYYDDYMLFLKYLNYKYVDRYRGGEKNIIPLNDRYGTDFPAYKDIKLTIPDIKSVSVKAKVKDWYEFLSTLPQEYWMRGFNYELLKEYQKTRKKKYKTVHELNLAYSESLEDYQYLRFPYDDPLIRTWQPDNNTKWKEYLEFKDKIPINCRLVVATNKKYIDYLKNKYQEIDKLNSEYETNYKSFNNLRLPSTVPKNKNESKDWEVFVREKFPFRYTTLSGGDEDYREFLKRQYGSLKKLNSFYKTNHKNWLEVKLSSTEPVELGPLKLDWRNFILKSVPVRYLTIEGSEQKYYRFLEQKYKTIKELNKIYETNYSDFKDAEMPFKEVDYSDFYSQKGSYRFKFFVNNYADVLSYMLINGRASINTVILVVAMILTNLTVNPMCAYALSRYNLPYAYKILLFLLATMAFPAEVGMIPGFLLLKQFHLLNTYWALILPGMASGYYIFILKGFFDSLPKDLYESAMLDGASERQMFWNITLPLSKPVFAVIALWTFVGAYGGFMWAFIICQDPKMWTIMVTLYQFQQANANHLVFASLVFAALPTLLIFAFAQKMIMKGIILPVEK